MSLTKMSNHKPPEVRTALTMLSSDTRSEDRRAKHLARRNRVEEKVYRTYVKSWFRKCFDAGAILNAALFITGLRDWAARNAMSHQYRKVVFEYESLPPAFHGFRIMHLTDLHINGHPGLADHLHNQIKDVPVDLCLLTGDYLFRVGHGEHEAHAYMEHVISGVDARGGCIGILGNHDIASNAKYLESLGVRMLINEAVEIKIGDENIWIAGVDDPHDYKYDDLPAADIDIPEEAFKILMAHSPEIYKEAADLGYKLYLCGHTHAGQVQIPGIGPIITKARAPRRFTYGTWQQREMCGYTSSGIGASGLFARVFCPPEIGLIELRRKTSGG